MANNMVYLEKNGIIKEAPVGFSWTTLIFGCFPMLFRGDWKWFFIQLLVQLLTLGWGCLVTAFFINKWSLTSRIEDGWKVRSVDHGEVSDVLGVMGVIVPAK